MGIGEDLRMSLRSIGRRLVESLLLIIGISLGIGATAAGIAMVARSRQTAEELLSSTEYREIVITIREEAEDMDLPAVRQDSTEEIILTSADLAAADEAPDVQYAYLMNDTHFDLDTDRMMGFMKENQAEPVRSTSDPSAQTDEQPAAESELQNTLQTSNAETTGSAGQSGNSGAQPPLPPWLLNPDDIPELEGPEPVLEDMNGYEVSPEFFEAWNLYAAQGSLFTPSDMEKGSSLLVLGADLAKELFEDGESLGRDVINRFELYTIVGILEPTGTGFDNSAFAPAFMPDLQGAIGPGRRNWNTTLHFTVTDAERLDEASSQLTSWFDRTYGPGLVTIQIPREEAEMARDRTARLTAIILFLALSGLLIASVNVSNILMSRALRKRRTVGILKALGASVKAVFRLFFVEALFVSVGGALVGTGLAIILSHLMEVTMGVGAIPGLMLGAGVFLAWVITKALTIIPSVQASRIPAAEAIRYE